VVGRKYLTGNPIKDTLFSYASQKKVCNSLKIVALWLSSMLAVIVVISITINKKVNLAVGGINFLDLIKAEMCWQRCS